VIASARRRAAAERAVLVGVCGRGNTRGEIADHLDALGRLLETAGGEEVGRVVLERDRPDPATFIGRGRAENLRDAAAATGSVLVVFDDDLAPAQARNLEDLLQVRVIDRAALILEIFARRARSREARTQVELARLRYLLPRLARRWGHFSRQAGGIGVRDVGETQLELDRRMVRRRIGRLEADLARIDRGRVERRKRRRALFQVAVVGYTNSGKTTLLNALTGGCSPAEDRLFATLDPLVRRWEAAPGLALLVIDTVGFVRKLPHDLVASFRSTLQEAGEADLLLHVIDLSHPGWEAQADAARRVLADLEIRDAPVFEVFNKIDRVAEAGVVDRARRLHPDALFVSALRGAGIRRLEAALRAAGSRWAAGEAAAKRPESDAGIDRRTGT
jgi:GTPase